MLELRGVSKSFDKIPVLRKIDLSVEHGEIICLLGPSGCGKTTLLRIIAGLERGDEGMISVDGNDIQAVPVHQRDFGLMFQDFALFPHLNVEQNVVFGLRMKGIKLTQKQARAKEVLELVGLADFAKRDVNELSGGEKQRVALARSLAPNPRLLMLDEPLSSLDAALRERLVLELRTIIKQLGLTTVYVTHDQQEAFAIADRIAIMNAGHIEQIGTPEIVYAKPKTVFVAQFLGLNNILSVNQRDNDLKGLIEKYKTAHSEWVLFHPDAVQIAAPQDTDAIIGRVVESVFQGSVFRIKVVVSPETTLMFRAAENVDPGSELSLSISSSGIITLQNQASMR